MASHSSGYSYLLRRHRSTPFKSVTVKTEPVENCLESESTKKDVCHIDIKREPQAEGTVPAKIDLIDQLDDRIFFEDYCTVEVKQELLSEVEHFVEFRLQNLQTMAKCRNESLEPRYMDDVRVEPNTKTANEEQQHIQIVDLTTDENEISPGELLISTEQPKDVRNMGSVDICWDIELTANESSTNLQDKSPSLLTGQIKIEPKSCSNNLQDEHTSGMLLDDNSLSILTGQNEPKSRDKPRQNIQIDDEAIASEKEIYQNQAGTNAHIILDVANPFTIDSMRRKRSERWRTNKEMTKDNTCKESPKPEECASGLQTQTPPSLLPEILIECRKEPTTVFRADYKNTQNHTFITETGVTNITKSFGNTPDPCLKYTKTKTSDAIKTESPEAPETKLSDLDVSNTDTIIRSIKQEYLEVKGVELTSSQEEHLLMSRRQSVSNDFENTPVLYSNHIQDNACNDSLKRQKYDFDHENQTTPSLLPEAFIACQREHAKDIRAKLDDPSLQTESGAEYQNEPRVTATRDFPDSHVLIPNHNKTKTSDIVKKEPQETSLSELDVCNADTLSCSYKQEYIEIASVMIPDVKEDTPLNMESSHIFVNTEYSADVDPSSLHPTYAFSVVELPPSKEEKLLIPSRQPVSNKKAVEAKGKSDLKQNVCDAREKHSSSIKSRPTSKIRGGRNSNKRRRRDWSYRYKSGSKISGGEMRTTRNKTNEQKLNDFPKPLKCEKFLHQGLCKQTATELPQPMVLKVDSASFNTNKQQTYRIRDLQPRVRLKRLTVKSFAVNKSEKTTLDRSSTQDKPQSPQYSYPSLRESKICRGEKEHIIVQNAFSLSPCVEETGATTAGNTRNLGSDCSRPFVADASNDDQHFTHQEFMQATTSGAESTANFNQSDSGVSTSSRCRRDNATVLLEIAAERAFINNHLIQFGYSPIQFNLYNDLNDMCIFLKYLFGQANINHM